MKRAGFTMIELIFVIVILGILAAVAVPKLAATRTDAGVSKMAANLATVISDMGSYWTANGAWPTNWNGTNSVTNVPLTTEAGGTTASSAMTVLTAYLNAGTGGETEGCYSIVITADGNVTVSSIASATATNPVCVGAKITTDKNNLSSGDGIVTSFGGMGVTY